MTIPHEDLIRAVLDGKTVQWRDNRQSNAIWLDYESPIVAIQQMATDDDIATEFRLKPEPRCVWTAAWPDESQPGGMYAISLHKRPESNCKGTILRHEFDPDTGEYLQTVKEEA